MVSRDGMGVVCEASRWWRRLREPADECTPSPKKLNDECCLPHRFIVLFFFLLCVPLCQSLFHEEAQLPWVKRSMVLRRGPVYVAQDCYC